jgi:hypothetical protein
VLSDRDRLMLEFERAWWLLPGPKEAAIREHLEVSATRYYQALTRLLDDPDAMEYDPLTIRRLRRLRESRRRERLDERLAGGLGGQGGTADGGAQGPTAGPPKKRKPET